MLRQRVPNIYKRQMKIPHFFKDPKTKTFLFFSFLFFRREQKHTREKGKAETQSETEISDRYILKKNNMAASKSYYARPNYRFLPTERDHHLGAPIAHDSAFELDESDIYNSVRSNSPECHKQTTPISRVSKKPSSKPSPAERAVVVGATPSSLPVNIPDWSKILRDEYRDNNRYRDNADDDEFDGDEKSANGGRVPPHEFLAKQMARTRIASFSVHEGVGRTLKGRDLSRVRNAIWEKTGFED